MEPLTQTFNDCIENSTLPDELKCADVTSLPNNGPIKTRANFRPIGILPTVSKLFERIMDHQIAADITPFLSSLLCSFQQSYSAQRAIVRLLEKFKISIDEGGKVGAVLMDLSKAFNCFRHDLLIAKMHAYGLSREPLTFINKTHKCTTASYGKWIFRFLERPYMWRSSVASFRPSVTQHIP